jgi:hypothetical protein
MIGGALASITLLKASLYRSVEQAAGQEARVVADLGLDAALSHGRLTAGDLQIAASQYAVARRDLPLTGVVIWLPSGKAIFARGSGRVKAAGPTESKIATVARTTDTTRVADAANPNSGATVEAAVPLGQPAVGAVAEFYFARGGIQRNLSQAERWLYLLTGIGVLIMLLAVLPSPHAWRAACPYRSTYFAAPLWPSSGWPWSGGSWLWSISRRWRAGAAGLRAWRRSFAGTTHTVVVSARRVPAGRRVEPRSACRFDARGSERCDS